MRQRKPPYSSGMKNTGFTGRRRQGMQPQRRLASSPPANRRWRGVREKIPHLALFGLLVTAACAALAAAPTERVSVSSAELQGNSISFDPATNSDGRYVAF